MSKSRKEKRPPDRRRFPDEEKLPWLSLLLDAYEIINKGVNVVIEDEKRKRKIKLACKKGCDTCCRTHRDIPVYPHELVGIYWFTAEKLTGNERETLKKRLLGRVNGDACPFLAEGSCAIHPLRPAACRQFNVFNISCAEGEDPYYTRREDVMTPIQGYVNRAFSIMLPFYNIAEGADSGTVVQNIIHSQAVNLQTYDWKRLVSIIDGADSRKADITPEKNRPNPAAAR